MKKIQIKVNTLKNESVISVIKKIYTISCRISLDFTRDIITIENVDNSAILEEVIDLINKKYTISNVEIDNYSDVNEQSKASSVAKTVSENSNNSTANVEISKTPVEETNNITVNFEKETVLTIPNIYTEEETLLEMFGFAFKKLAYSKSINAQIKTFIDDIEMSHNKIVYNSFLAANKVKKICYDSILSELTKVYPEIKSNVLKNTLQEEFKAWLEKNPLISERCSRISIMAILKLFVKTIRNTSSK